MLKFIKQQGPSCALAALCQVRPDLDYQSLVKEYLSDGTWNNLTGQVKFFRHIDRGYAMKMAEFYRNAPLSRAFALVTAYKGEMPPAPDLSGKGVLIVTFPTGNHSISFENGKILDADYNGTLETWEEFYNRQNKRWEACAEHHECPVVPVEVLRFEGGRNTYPGA